MPELPEVETVRRILHPQLAGQAIRAVTVNRADVLAHPAPDEFCRAVAGRRIEGVGRRGKFLRLGLAGGGEVLVHLRMTGCLVVAPAGWPEEKHTHVVFHLDGKRELRFSDARRFGRLWLCRPGEEDTFSGVHKLGPEPFDEAFDAAYLQRVLGARRRAIKECLLDQSVVAGIGNIYGDEILFAAHIHPGRPAASLSKQEWARLAEAVPAVLQKGIEADRVTPQAYLESRGQSYRSAPSFVVYGHEGRPCPACGTPLRRMVLGGRSSCYCPACQKA